MSEAYLEGSGWLVHVIMTDAPSNGVYHAYARSRGDTKEDALNGAKAALDLLCKGRRTWIRVAPEAVSDTDFDTKITHHRGNARFSFMLEPGEWETVERVAPSLLGFA